MLSSNPTPLRKSFNKQNLISFIDYHPNLLVVNIIDFIICDNKKSAVTEIFPLYHR